MDSPEVPIGMLDTKLRRHRASVVHTRRCYKIKEGRHTRNSSRGATGSSRLPKIHLLLLRRTDHSLVRLPSNAGPEPGPKSHNKARFEGKATLEVNSRVILKGDVRVTLEKVRVVLNGDANVEKVQVSLEKLQVTLEKV